MISSSPQTLDKKPNQTEPTYYKTVQVNSLEIKGCKQPIVTSLTTNGIQTNLYSNGKRTPLADGPKWTKAAGWGNPQYCNTIRTNVIRLNGHDRLILIARAADGIHTYSYDPVKNVWAFLGLGPKWTNAGGWSDPKYYNTIQTNVIQKNGCDVLVLFAKAADGIHTYHFEKGAWRFLGVHSQDAKESKKSSNHNNQFSLMHAAAVNGDIGLLEYLISQGFDLHVKDKNGWNAVDYAINNNQPAAVKFLASKGLVANPAFYNAGSYVQHWVAQRDYSEILKIFIEQGVGLTIVDKNGSTPLYVAAEGGSLEAARVILEKANPAVNYRKDYAVKNSGVLTKVELINKPNKFGRVALHAAAANGNIALLEYIISQGANLYVKCSRGWNAVDYAINNNQPAAVKFLASKGLVANPAFYNPESYVQHWVARRGYSEILKGFIEQGVGLTIVDKNGSTPLYVAAEGGCLEAARVILEKANPAVNYRKDYAVKNSGVLTKVELINKPNKFGRVALHAAAANGNIALLEYLISEGANLHAKCNSGLNAADYAARNGKAAAKQWLENITEFDLGNNQTVSVFPAHSSSGGKEFVVTYRSLKEPHISYRAREVKTIDNVFTDHAEPQHRGVTVSMTSDALQKEIKNHGHLPESQRSRAAIANITLKEVNELHDVIHKKPQHITNLDSTVKSSSVLKENVLKSHVVVQDDSGVFFSKYLQDHYPRWTIGQHVVIPQKATHITEKEHNQHSEISLSHLTSSAVTALQIAGKHINPIIEKVLVTIETMERYKKAPTNASTAEKMTCAIIGTGVEGGAALLVTSRLKGIAQAVKAIGTSKFVGVAFALGAAYVQDKAQAGTSMLGNIAQNACHATFRLFDGNSSAASSTAVKAPKPFTQSKLLTALPVSHVQSSSFQLKKSLPLTTAATPPSVAARVAPIIAAKLPATPAPKIATTTSFFKEFKINTKIQQQPVSKLNFWDEIFAAENRAEAARQAAEEAEIRRHTALGHWFDGDKWVVPVRDKYNNSVTTSSGGCVYTDYGRGYSESNSWSGCSVGGSSGRVDGGSRGYSGKGCR